MHIDHDIDLYKLSEVTIFKANGTAITVQSSD